MDQIDAESIGLVCFRQNGPRMFCNAVENALRNQAESRSWYITIIDALVRKQMVNVCPVPKDLWCEIDIAADLAIAEELVSEMAIRQNCRHTSA
jgi:choline kinase